MGKKTANSCTGERGEKKPQNSLKWSCLLGLAVMELIAPSQPAPWQLTTEIVLIALQCSRCCWTGLAGCQGFLCPPWGWQEAGSGHSQDSTRGWPKGCCVSHSARLSHRTGGLALPWYPLFGGWLGTGLLVGKVTSFASVCVPLPFPLIFKLFLYLDPQAFSLLLFWFSHSLPHATVGEHVITITPYTENRKSPQP